MTSNWVRIIADPRKPGFFTYECVQGHQWDVPVSVRETGNTCPTCQAEDTEKEPDVE